MLANVHRWAQLLLAFGCAACHRDVAFACLQDEACSGGHCEPDGWCSFEDSSCATGRRYGRWAGDGQAQRCVEEGNADTRGTSPPETSLAGEVTTSASTSDGSAASIETTAETTTSTGAAADSTGDEPLPPDLVAWYAFDADSRQGVVLDTVGNHPGSCEPSQCPEPTDGVRGLAGSFDGVDDLVRVTHDAGLELGAVWTVAVWMQPTVADFEYHNLLGKPVGPDGFLDTIELALNQGTTVRVSVGSEFDSATVTSRFGPGTEWIHVAATSDGETIRLYLDGEVSGEGVALVPAYSELDWTIGAGLDALVPSNHFFGALDELRLYRIALTPEAIAMLVAAP